MEPRPNERIIETRATKPSSVEEILAEVLLRLLDADKLAIREEKT
jgi:hypothetical protein